MTVDGERANALAELLGPPCAASELHPWTVAIPLSESFQQVMRDPGEDIDQTTVVHAFQAIEFVEPIPFGTPLQTHATIDGLGQFGLASGLLIGASVSAGGRLLCRSRSVLASQAVVKGPQLKVDRWRVRGGSVLARRSHVLSPRDVQAYAERSGDRNPIHTSPAVARSVGLRDAVVHGMFTLGVAVTDAISELADGDCSRVERVQARFSKFLCPNEPFEVELRGERPDGDFAISVTAGGHRLLRDCVVGLRPAG